MHYEKLKELYLKAYPRLFVDEEDVLHQLFFVNGNGCEWENGELGDGLTEEETLAMVEGDRKAYEKELTELSTTAEMFKACGIEQHSFYGKTPEETREKELKYRRDSIEEYDEDENRCWFLLPSGEVGHKLYPLCKYASILETPEDVKPDWLEAAWKALRWAKSEKVRRNVGDDKYLAEAEELLRARSGR